MVYTSVSENLNVTFEMKSDVYPNLPDNYPKRQTVSVAVNEDTLRSVYNIAQQRNSLLLSGSDTNSACKLNKSLTNNTTQALSATSVTLKIKILFARPSTCQFTSPGG